MDDIERFLRDHQLELLRRLDTVSEWSTVQTRDYVQQVLDDWAAFAAGRDLRRPDRRERTFWYALFELEEIAEFPSREDNDPFMMMMLNNLGKIRDLLLEWGDLPIEYYATRPGEGACQTFSWQIKKGGQSPPFSSRD